MLGVFVPLPIASAAVAGVTGRKSTDVRSSVAFDVFSADRQCWYLSGGWGELVSTYLSSQRRRLNLPQCVHLKLPSPSLVLGGLCNETTLDVVVTSLLFVFSVPLK